MNKISIFALALAASASLVAIAVSAPVTEPVAISAPVTEPVAISAPITEPVAVSVPIAAPVALDDECTGPKCKAKSYDFALGSGGYPPSNFHLTPVLISGEVNKIEGVCYNCTPCEVEYSVWEDNPNCTFSYTGGAQGNVPTTEGFPAKFTLTNSCLNSEASDPVTFSFECWGGQPYEFIEVRVKCTNPCPDETEN